MSEMWVRGQEKENEFTSQIVGGLGQTIVPADPVPTPFANKHSGTMYRCPNCGHEWNEKM